MKKYSTFIWHYQHIKSKIRRFILIVVAFSGFYMNLNNFPWKCMKPEIKNAHSEMPWSQNDKSSSTYRAADALDVTTVGLI